ncbi:origin recognition complex subunit 5 C-terminus-domain-containing protein, partial [Phellopilus nigrolimitatus]
PGQETLIHELKTIIPAKSPSFIYVLDPFTTNRTRSILRDVLKTLTRENSSERFAFAFVDCVACFTQRLIFDTILNSLANFWEPRPEENANDTLAGQRSDSLDGFLESIRMLSSDPFPITSGSEILSGPSKFALVFERAERLKEIQSKLVIPLTRLQELTGRDITTIFLAEIEWEHLTPLPGLFPDPYRIVIETLSKDETVDLICESFPHDSAFDFTASCNPSLRPLFVHFVETVYNVCAPFTTDLKELEYIVSARWPGFVSPILEDWKRQDDGPYLGPSEESRIRLMRLFSSSLTNAVESLYPRNLNASDWSESNSFPKGFRLSQALGRQLTSTTSSPDLQVATLKLSSMSMFIILASFLASYNPAKTDYRMFGRGADERSKRKRKGGGARKTKPGAVAKVSHSLMVLPQRLIGPMTFPYDRLVAILGSLLREYDESEQTGQSFKYVFGLKEETDVYRVQTSASIQELISLRVLYRTTPQERIEASSFKCGIGYEQALSLARKLGMPLIELMWEPN